MESHIENISEKYTDLRSKIVAVVEKEMSAKSIEVKKAYAIATYFLMNNTNIYPDDIFAGNIIRCDVTTMFPSSIEEEFRFLNKAGVQEDDFSYILQSEKIGMFTRSPGSHVVLAYDKLIQNGIRNQIRKAQDCLCRKNISTSKQQFYIAEFIVLCAMQKRILKYAEEAKKQYNYTRNIKLKHIQIACENIAYNPPQTFYEAIQLIILAHENIVAESGSGSMSFGRLDQYLYPLYKKDICIGNLSIEKAQEYLNAFWKKISRCEMGWQNITLGGCSQTGEDMCNDLTILCMNSSLAIQSDQPQISLRIHNGTPKNVWKKAFELIRTGMGFPSLFNDEVAIKAKMNAGISVEDAWNYSIVGCVELTSGGKEYSHTEGARFNWQKLLELMLNDGKCLITGLDYPLKEKHNLEEIQDFYTLYSWYKRELIYFTKRICNCIDILSKQYSQYWPVPFLSSMMQGCHEAGCDATNGGTVYNNLTLNCVGIANVADSLEAIETLVFKEKCITLKELSIVLQKNYKGYELIHKKVLNCPKYGNDIQTVDNKVQDLTDTFVDTLSKTSMKYRSGSFQAGFYSSYFHATMGKLTGASPDGRKASNPLSSSLSPMSGMDRDGPTAVVNSISHINMERFSNGMVLDMKFTPNFFMCQKSIELIKVLIEEYFDRGGLEIQFNVFNRDTLLQAQKEPIKYRNLIVRVSGFSAYFVSLEKSLQDEIIKRTEFQIT